MNDLVKQAKAFATQAHRRIQQVRKYTGKPYDVHLKRVAEIVREVTEDPAVIAAAWLHDVVEDTPATLDEVERAFGQSVAALVEQLTDVSLPSDGNRERRVALNREHTARASSNAKTVKLADLIDNCNDICQHDPRFAPIFLTEMAVLLEVLNEGDASLLARARRVLDKCSEQLGLGKNQRTAGGKANERPFDRWVWEKYPKVVHRFARTFFADDLSEQLPLFDADAAPSRVLQIMKREGYDVVGIRQDGVVAGYLRPMDLEKSGSAIRAIAFKTGQIVNPQTPLSDVVEILTRHDHCFVGQPGAVDAVVRRKDVQKPVARTWLFGLITLLELYLTQRIQELWPGDSWTDVLSPARLRQAESLRAERLRLQQPCSLLDCLQISDKGSIILRNPLQLAAFGFVSKREGDQTMREIQSLRNNLAHAQDIVTNDWPQIVRLARRLESLVPKAPGAAVPEER